jgi:hypothetical protein
MVEQRPFKALVVGSSPTQPIFSIFSLGFPEKRPIEPLASGQGWVVVASLWASTRTFELLRSMA